MEKYTYIRKTITWDSRRYEVRGKTEQEACEKLADLVVSLKRGEFAASGQTTVEQWFQQWMQTYKIPSGITPKSLRLYDEKYNGYIGPAIGQKKLQDVRDLHLQTILNTQAGRSYSHVSKLRMVLQELFRQARRSRLIVFDPAEGLQLPESTKRSHRPITAAERRHILALAQEHRAGLWVLTILYAGLRPGETAALSWKDIDFDRNEIHVYKAIESGTKTVKAVKSHHNVGGLPEDLKFELVEPLKMLFKDEVRACGKALGLPDSMVYRQPFPGPGLGVRCLGAITRDRLEAVRESDAILREEFAAAGLQGRVWQYFTVVPDFKSVGAFDWPVILRAVNTVDAMTATVEDVPFALLQKITARITSEVKGVNRVLYDLTPKPSGTIEWE